MLADLMKKELVDFCLDRGAETYSDVVWSPDSRFLVTGSKGISGESRTVLLDTATGYLAELEENISVVFGWIDQSLPEKLPTQTVTATPTPTN